MMSEKKRPKIAIIVIVTLIALLVVACAGYELLIWYNTPHPMTDPVKYEYRNDPEVFEKERFSGLPAFESCIWKTGYANNPMVFIGPTDYWFRAFLVLTPEETARLKQEYDWKKADAYRYGDQPEPLTEFTLIFPEGFDPDITGLSDFNWEWRPSYDFSIKGYFGTVWLDEKNGLLYLDLEGH